VKSGKIILVAS